MSPHVFVRSRLHRRVALVPLLLVPVFAAGVADVTAQLDPNAVTLTVPGSAVRCSEFDVVMTSSEAHESASLRTTGVRVLSSITEQCGFGPGPCQLCRGGPCTSIGEWNPPIGYRGPIHFVFEATGTSQATFYVDWDDGNVGPPYYRTKTYTMQILVSGTPVVIVIRAAPAEIPADGRSTSAITVKVKDQSCRPLPNIGVTLTTDKGTFAGGGTSTTVTTNSSGLATATLVAASSPGTATVTAGAFGTFESTTVEMKGCELSFSLNPQVIRADPRATSVITARLVDGAGAAMSAADMTLTTNFSTLTAGGATGTSLNLTTDSAGRTVATLQGVATPQRAEITATAACGATASTFIVLSADEDASLGPGLDIPYIADPVHPGIGNYTYAKRLFGFPGQGLPLDFTVYYNSRAAGTTGPLGYGWRHAYDTKLAIASDEVVVNWGSGRLDRFLVQGSTYTSLAPQDDVVLSKPDASTYEVLLVKPRVRYRFDTSGRLTSITDAGGHAITLTYSTRLDRITDSAGRQVTFTYDGTRIASIATPLRGGATAAFAYDGAGDLVTLTDARDAGWRFTYDAAHRLRTYTGANGHVVLTNTYDGDGRVTSQADAFGRLTRFERRLEETGTAVTVTFSDGGVVRHRYDFAFNAIEVVDGEGGTVSRVTGGSVTTFAYDAVGQLLSVTTGGQVTSYAYDGRDLRVSASVDGTATGYLRDEARVYCLLEATGTPTRYLIGTDQLLYSIGADGSLRTYHGDERGSVIAITDGDGAEVQSYVYGPYGDVLASQGGLANEFQYLGQHWVMADANGLLHMNARYYLPEARRFLTEDPIGLGGGPNVHAYAEGDPVNRSDPSGLQPPPVWHPQLAKALEFFITKGFEAGYRNAGYLVPQNAVKLGQIYLDSQTVTEYLAATRTPTQLMYQSATDFQSAYGGGTSVTSSWTTAGNIGKGSVIQSNTLSLAKPTTNNFATQIGSWSRANRSFSLTTQSVTEGTVTWGSRIGRVAGRVGKVLGPVGWVISAGLEGWEKGRQIGQSALVWDPGQGRWITVDESHQWIYNQYNGWVDQPEMFDYIDPAAYAAWQSKRYGDGTNQASKGDGSLLKGATGGGR